MRAAWPKFWIFLALAASPISVATVTSAADDVARFGGTWKTNFPYNGQLLTLASVHDGGSFKNYVLLPNGSQAAGEGTFTAADGKYTITSSLGNDSGTYQFADENTLICKNAAGQTFVWTRDKVPLPPIIGAPAPANPPPAAARPSIPPEVLADIKAKLRAGDDENALHILNEHGAAISPDPWLCITHASLMMKMENYRQARAEMTYFLQHTFDNPDTYVMHAQASAAMGDMRWADEDLRIAAQLRPASTEADRKSIATYAAIDPSGFANTELPAQLDQLVKMSARQEKFDVLVKQAMRIVKGEWNIRKVEADEYRERKRQLVAATQTDPQHAKPFVDLASFLYEQSCAIHGDGREGLGIVAYRFIEPTAERKQAIAWTDAALKIEPRNAQAMSIKAGAMIAMGDDDLARPVIDRALAINPNEPELLRMFSQLMTRSAWSNSDAGDQLATPLMWEDDQYTYMKQRSPEDLAQAREFNAAAGEDRDKAAAALQSAVDQTKGTPAGFYYQAVQFHRTRDEVNAGVAMEQAVKLAPDNIGYRDFLAELYSHQGWRRETEFFTQWSIADNLGQTSAAKMLRLAWKQLRRREYEPARQSLAEAMRLDPADARGPAYMGLLIAGENQDRGRADESASWLLAASAIEEANMRLWGLRHFTPSIMYTSDQVGLQEGLAVATGRRLMALNRPQNALVLARLAIEDANRVEKPRWSYQVHTAMLPLPDIQQTPAPHMDPVKATPTYNTTYWAINCHQLAGDALKSLGQSDEASREYAAANMLQQSEEKDRRNAPPRPMRR